MSIRQGIRTALGIEPRQVTASTVLAPFVPAPELASPWADRSALESLTVASMYGPDFNLDSLPLTRTEAMAIPAVARARTILCTTLARLDLVVVDVTGHPSTAPSSLFIAQPCPSQSRYIQVLWTVDDLIFYGVSWWQVQDRYAEDRRPRAARRVLPGGVEFHPNGTVTVYGSPVDPADLIRIDGPHEGILSYASRSLRLAGRLESTAARYAANPVAHTELHQTDATPMPKPQKDALIAGWQAARAGANGGVAYTSHNIEVKEHGAAPEHLLTAGRNAQAIDVARHIGVPADAIDASPEKASQTYANRTDRLGILVDYGLAAYGAAVTARLSMNDVCALGLRVELDYDGITAVSDDKPDTAAPKSPAPTSGAPAA